MIFRPISCSRAVLKVILFLSLAWMVSCSTVRKLPEGAALLTKNEIQVNGSPVNNSELKSALRQKENKRLLGVPLKLLLYQTANEKGTRLNRWLRSKGEPPVIYDSVESVLSLARLNRAYRKLGYFNTASRFDLKYTKSSNKVKQQFSISTGDRFFIDSLGLKIDDSNLRKLVAASNETSLLHSGDFLNSEALENERQRLLNLLRQQGTFGLQKSNIYFEIDGDTTATNTSHALHVFTVIDPSADSERYQMGTVRVFIDQLNDLTSSVTDTVNQVQFYHSDSLIDLKEIERRIAFKPELVYSDAYRTTTLNQLGQLNYFAYPSFNYQTRDDRYVDLNLYLRSRKRYSLTADFDITHSAIQQIGTSLRSSILARNVFGSFENLSLSLSGTIGNSIIPGANVTSELGVDLNLSFPRWWFGVSLEDWAALDKNPLSTLQIGTVFQQNLGLDRQTFNGIYRFNFSAKGAQHTLEFPKLSYVNNLNPDNFFTIYRNTYETLNQQANEIKSNALYAELFEPSGENQELQLNIPEGTAAFISGVTNNEISLDPASALLVRRIEERRARLTENNFILSSSYAYLKENTTNRNATDYRQLFGKIEFSGWLLDALEPFNNPGELFGVRYAHYVKTELQFIRHWPVGQRSSLAVRAYGGLAVPFGSSGTVPFVRSFFAGGTNDIRAWNAYTLGPGTTNQINEFNDANLKLTLSGEWRFPLSRSLYGALFTDVGNIWNALDDTSNEQAIFYGWRSLKDSAIASGFGLRYDFDYFIFRLDLAWKLHNPALEGAERWIFNRPKNNALFNIGINYPF